MAWSIYAWPRILPSDIDVLYSFDLSRAMLALRSLVKRSGFVIANRAGVTPTDGRIAAAEVEQILDGFVTETETQAAGYDTRVLTRAIPLLALEPAPLPRTPSLKKSNLRVAYLGRYERPKGIFRLVDIWSEARPQKAELAFYGVGPHRSELAEYIRDRGLSAVATVNDGWVTSEQQAAILANVDLVMLPSDSEGFPLVLLEAMAHGVPFIATEVGGIRELARDNPDVAVVPLDNAAFVKALRDMLTRIRAGEISAERLQHYYAERYAPEKIAAQWRAALLEPEKFWGPRASASKEPPIKSQN